VLVCVEDVPGKVGMLSATPDAAGAAGGRIIFEILFHKDVTVDAGAVGEER
jgi:hypothetical protein